MLKKILTKFALTALLVLPLGIATPAGAVTAPYWNTTGSYVIDMDHLGTDYPHDMSLTQDGVGNLTGGGGSPAGANVYTWAITSGTVSGNTIDFLANYTATADAVVPQTVLHVTGTIASDGTMSGTWSDNYQAGARDGTWESTSGDASPLGSLAAEDFGVVDYDTGLGQLRGYTAGFGLTDAVFTDATSVVVQLYAAGNTLLQTNSFDTDNAPLITGAQISSPFDVSGTFNYATDGYWTNVRETQYGQSVPAVKVVATVTLANGKVLVAENTNLTGDPTSIYPETEPVTDTTVHIFKYIDGVQATTVNADSDVFPMFTSTFNAPFTLGPGGWTTGDIDYEASTSPMALGSSYSAEEKLDTSLVGSSCDGNHEYSLVGYGTGNTLLEATQATTSLTIPSFTDLQSDKYIVVKNHKCSPTVPPNTATITATKIVCDSESDLPNWGAGAADITSTTASTFLAANPDCHLEPWTFEWAPNGTSNPGDNDTGDTGGAWTEFVGNANVPAGAKVWVREQLSSDYLPFSGDTTIPRNQDVSAELYCHNDVLNYDNFDFVSSIVAGATYYCVGFNVLQDDTSPTGESISGMKYNDLNRNGRKGANEPGLAGWVIKLKQKNTTVATTTTDANGNYSFNNLAPGKYKVREVQQNGWIRTSKNPKAIWIEDGSVITDVNFGNTKKQNRWFNFR